MASSSSSNASSFSISSASLIGLQAELAKRKDAIKKSQASSSSSNPSYIKGGSLPPKLRPDPLRRSNKGLSKRKARDEIVYEEEDFGGNEIERSKKALERKAKMYEQIRKGKTAGLQLQQIDSLLVDFDAKQFQHQPDSDDDSEDEDTYDRDESLRVPKNPGGGKSGEGGGSDEMVEYQDEFGRTRRVKKSEVPREVLERERNDEGNGGDAVEENPNVYAGPQTQFPVYEPTPEELAARITADTPLFAHYEADRENRTRGAGFYGFSQDEEERRREQEEIKNMREETEETRQKAQVGKGKSKRELDLEVRKRKIEERRREIEERRKRKAGGAGDDDAKGKGKAREPVDTPTDEGARAEQINGERPAKVARLDNAEAFGVEAQARQKPKSDHAEDPPVDEAEIFLNRLREGLERRPRS